MIAHIHVGPRQHLELASDHHFFHVDTGLGEPLKILFAILVSHYVCGLFAPVEVISVERAKHPVLFVHGAEKSTEMISPTGICTEQSVVIDHLDIVAIFSPENPRGSPKRFRI